MRVSLLLSSQSISSFQRRQKVTTSLKMLSSLVFLAYITLTNAASIQVCPGLTIQDQQACSSKILDKITQTDLKLNEVCQVIDETILECTEGFAQCQMK